MLFFVLFIPYNFLYLTYQTLGLGAKIGACIMSNTAMGFGGMLIAMWEGTGDGTVGGGGVTSWWRLRRAGCPR